MTRIPVAAIAAIVVLSACDSPTFVEEISGVYEYDAIVRPEPNGLPSYHEGNRWTGELLLEGGARYEVRDREGLPITGNVQGIASRGSGGIQFHVVDGDGYVYPHVGTRSGSTITGTFAVLATLQSTDTIFQGTFTAVRR